MMIRHVLNHLTDDELQFRFGAGENWQVVKVMSWREATLRDLDEGLISLEDEQFSMFGQSAVQAWREQLAEFIANKEGE